MSNNDFNEVDSREGNVENFNVANNSEGPGLFEAKKKAKIEIGEGQDVIDAIIAPTANVTPWETVTLPSKGYFYDGEVPEGIVKVRPMDMAADKVMATQRLASSGKSMDYLFKTCVQMPGNFNPLNLLSGDRIFLLYYLRGITHGNMYDFITECTQCGGTNSLSYDLNNLDVRYADDSLQGEEPFKVSLPRLSAATGHDVWVRVRFMRGYDLLRINKSNHGVKKIRPNSKYKVQDMALDDSSIDESLSENLSNLIVSVGSYNEPGNEDRMVINSFVTKMHSTDHAVIREYLKEIAPNVDTEVIIQCSHCGHEMRMALPLTESFFRPSK
jgi:hypothetical protein